MTETIDCSHQVIITGKIQKLYNSLSKNGDLQCIVSLMPVKLASTNIFAPSKIQVHDYKDNV